MKVWKGAENAHNAFDGPGRENLCITIENDFERWDNVRESSFKDTSKA